MRTQYLEAEILADAEQPNVEVSLDDLPDDFVLIVA